MTREILNWVDNKMEDVQKSDQPHSIPKAFGLGCLEGLLDVATMTGMIFIIVGSTTIFKRKQ